MPGAARWETIWAARASNVLCGSLASRFSTLSMATANCPRSAGGGLLGRRRPAEKWSPVFTAVMESARTPSSSGMRSVLKRTSRGRGHRRARSPGRSGAGPNVGILLYDGYSLLDPTGPAEVLSRLPDATLTMIAEKRRAVRADTADVAVVAERSIAEVDRLDVLLVPGAGNRGTVAATNNQALLPLDPPHPPAQSVDNLRVHREHCPRRGWTARGTAGDDVLGFRRVPPVHEDHHRGRGVGGSGHGPVSRVPDRGRPTRPRRFNWQSHTIPSPPSTPVTPQTPVRN